MNPRKILDRHFPTHTPEPLDLRLPIFIGIIVYFILAVMEPFGTDQSTTANKEVLLIGHGVIVAILVYILQNAIPRYFNRVYAIQNWTLAKSLLHGFGGLVSIGIFLYLYTRFAFPGDPAAPGFLNTMKFTFVIGAIQCIFIMGWNYIQFIQNDLGKAHLPNSIAPAQGVIANINAEDILLFEAQGNYIQVYYFDDGVLEKKLIRKTLAAVKAEVDGQGFLRCHRSYIVNMLKVVGQKGNAKGIKLTLSGLEKKVQVSRRYVRAVRQWLDNAGRSKYKEARP